MTELTRWTAARVREALGLPAPAQSGANRREAASGAGEPKFTRVLTDTRAIEPGALFVALAGERFDGHDYLDAAVTAGATGVVVRDGARAPDGVTAFHVPDTLRAFGLLARARRREITGPVIAVTGTNGKTSTKEMLAAALRTRWRTHATRANLNNLVGVPATILEAPADTEALVIEAGANVPGEIARYREIIDPSAAVITNVGAGHLAGFGSAAGVLGEKLSLLRDVPLAVVGTNPAALAEGARVLARRVVTAGLGGADRIPDRVSLDEMGRATVEVERHCFALPYPGRHLAENAMLAWTMARELELEAGAVAGALGRFSLPGGRTELRQEGRLTVLNDSYNANPQSFQAAIETARELRRGRRLVFVAGTMRELGPDAERLHLEVAGSLVELAPDLLAAVGEFVPALAPWRAQLGERLITAPDALSVGPLVAERLRGDEIVVLKASRGVALERILPHLLARAH
jgi:UDP-N-acetylmuramoyl-tripeptide--D-alanyl-D-alanine ligase